MTGDGPGSSGGGTDGAATGGSALLRAGAALRDGRYVLDRPLGRGGMAAVWLARDQRLGRPVAIKVLSDTLAGDPAYLSRFEREARVAAGLAHTNLIRIYDYGTEAGRPFLVMEYVAGGDLAERIAAGRAPDPERLARELLDALRYIHRAEILHRDVKAQNVLIDRDGRARLTDFGIARPADATSLTQTGIVLGTGRYIAPEVFAGEPPSERSDLYSLGVVLGEVLAKHDGSTPELGRLVAVLRAKDPERRPPSAAAALRWLERPAATAPQPPPAQPATAPPPASPHP
ncbi:MAG TPA: serine/threonine-protein kinase, partial [Solirubrobacterales bacterium]|nr:serine/threonine-protein kinase [Solirubrobacterales bacterium]